jgi:uncharacterized SAM-binding protein YcdF (DUF218 family)
VGEGVPFKRTVKRFFIILVILGLLAGATFWAFRRVGRWLVIEDPLQPAQAIVVLSGLIPYRAMEAAALFKQGWAPEVWLFKDDPRGIHDALARLGIRHIPEEEYNQQVLEKLGVPATAIHVIDEPSTNTANEFEILRQELLRRGGERVILVTSPVHTRRSRTIWRLIVGDHPQVILRYDSEEPSDPDHWWRSTQDIQDVVHEILGMIDARLGFFAKPQTR